MTTHARAAAVVGTGGDGRTVEVLLCRWDHPETVSDDGRTFYREQFARGGLRVLAGARLFVRNEHVPLPGTDHKPGADPRRDRVVVGRIVETHARADGLYGSIRMADNEDGRWLLGLIPDVLDTLSIEFDDRPQHVRAGQLVTRTDAVLTGAVFTLNPQRSDARVLAVRSLHGGHTHMDENENTDPTGEPAAEPAAERQPAQRSEQLPQGVTINLVGAAPAVAETAPQAQRSAPVPGGAGAGITLFGGEHTAEDLRLLHQFPTFGHYVRAAALANSDEAITQHMRALHTGMHVQAQVQQFRRAFATATTADIAGLLPPQWLTEVIDLVRVYTPTVQQFSRMPLPDTGLTITQPIVTQRPTVGKQASELAEPASQKVTIGTVQWTVDTYTGGDRMSLQSIRRSEPAYLNQVMRLFVDEMAKSWNAAVAAGVLAAADDVNTTALEWVDANGFGDLVIDAGAVFLQSLGRLPEVVGLSVGAWVALGKAKDTTNRALFPDVNPQNTTGTFDLTEPSGNIRKVAYFVDPNFGDESTITGVIGVRDAYRSAESPMSTLTADVPQALAQDVAVYQFGAHGKVDASGLMLFEDAA